MSNKRIVTVPVVIHAVEVELNMPRLDINACRSFGLRGLMSHVYRDSIAVANVIFSAGVVKIMQDRLTQQNIILYYRPL